MTWISGRKKRSEQCEHAKATRTLIWAQVTLAVLQIAYTMWKLKEAAGL